MDQIELIDKRKPREKHFLQKDGTIRAEVYGTDVHYLKDGKYEEIDNTLIKENDSLVNKSNDYKVEFKENIKDSLIKMSKDDHYIDFKIRDTKDVKLKSNKRQLSKEMKNVTYNNITDDITIEYQALSNAVKETIILQNANCSELSFELDTDLNLKEEDGQILALDNKENIVFRIEKPFMVDSNEIRNDNIYYKIQNYSDGYILDLILDDEWLQDKNRVYPVLIDPTILSNSQDLNMQDTYIYPGDTNEVRYNKAYLKAGVENINNTLVPNRTLIKFDLPEIGTGSEIVYATLGLTSYPSDVILPNDYVATIHQITSDWSESTACWSSMNDKFNSRVESIFYGHRSTYVENTVFPAYSEYDGNITNIVKKWYRNVPNYGLMIKVIDESSYVGDDFPAFFSRDNNITNNPKPVFSLVYRNYNGLENYLDYKVQDFTDGKTFVNTYNGNLTAIFDLGCTIGGNLPAKLGIVYNTNDAVLNKETFFKKGYKLTLEQTIKEVSIDNDNYLEYLDADGTLHYFINENDSNIYKDEDGLQLTVEKSNNLCTMTDTNDTIMEFTKINNIYMLTNIHDINNNTIDITYNVNNSISKITDKYLNEIELTYNANSIIITSPNKTVTLSYINNKLSSITSENGITRFEYNSDDLISSITDPTGIKINYTYYRNSPFRVYSVEQIGLNNQLGQSFVLEYGFDCTNVIDNTGKKATLLYNSFGNLISTNSLVSGEDVSSAYSINQKFGDDTNNKNKILNSQVPIKYIKNYLKNASFEQNQNNFIYDSNSMIISYSNDYYVSGNRSLKLESQSINKSIEQSFSLQKGKYYTFSGYFKSNNDINIQLSYNDGNDDILSIQNIKASNEFERHDVTIYYDENATSDLKITIALPEISIVYIDDVQLEEGEIANGFNMIENSDFSEGFSEWQLNGWTYDSSTITASDSFSLVNFNNNKNKALKVSVNPTYGISFSKIIPVKGKEGELYTLSFWYKNLGIPGYANIVGSAVSIYFKPIGTEAEYCIKTSDYFNPNEDKWQFFTYTAHAPEDFEYIKIVFLIGREANDFYLTNMSLYKNVTSGEYNYDEHGNLITITNQSNDNNIFKYDNNNKLISSTDALGKNFKYEYDNNKKDCVLSAISSSGIANRIKYDNNGNPISTKTCKKYKKNLTDGLYKIRNKGTDNYLKAELKNVFLEKNDCSNTIWYLKKEGNYFKIIYKLQPTYSLSYKNNHIVLDDSNTNNLFEIVKNTDNENGTYYIKYDESVNGGGNNILFLTSSGNIIDATLFSGDDFNVEFYIETLEELFVQNTVEYTTDGRFVQSITNSQSNTTTYITNSVSGLTTSATNAEGNTISYTYNNKGKPTLINEGSKNLILSYNNQNLLSEISLNNRVYKLIYDNFLNLYQTKIGDNIVLATNQYGVNNGNLTSTTYGNNHTISFTYDDFDRLKEIIRMDKTYKYLYNNNDNLSKIISNDSITKYQYDIANRLVKYNIDDFTIKYLYDKNNKLTEQKIIFGNNNSIITHTYDEEEKVICTNIDNITVDYTYDDLYRINTKSINETYDVSYNYIKNGKKTANLIKSMNNGFDEYNCIYDKNNNKTQIFTNNALTKKYEYDIYDELIADYDYVDGTKTEYGYDSYGNMTSKTIKSIDNNQVVESNSLIYNNSIWTDQLTSYNGNSISYDTIGNMIGYGNNISLSWINGRQLYSYSDSSKDLNITYKYNYNGIRESKNINNIETKYYLEGDDIVYEQTGNNIIYYIYDSNSIIGFKYNNDTYYYVKNIFGDIIGILDDSYNKIVNYKYDSWGKLLSMTDSSNNVISDHSSIGYINPFRYRGYYYDNETGLYYLNNRYYNPELCRFISSDNYISTDSGILGYNMYIYANNNPIKFIDYSGSFLLRLIFKAVVKVATAIYKKVTAKKTKEVNKKAQKEIKAVQQKKSEAKNNTAYTKKFDETLHKNAKIAETVSYLPDVVSLTFFAWKERQNGDWDLKSKKEWKQDLYYDGMIMEPQDIGNYHYGYVGRAMDIDIDTLVLAGGMVQLLGSNPPTEEQGWCKTASFCDDPRDTYFVRMGALAYDREHGK